MSLPPPRTGLELSNWINSPYPKRQYIAEGFINEKSCILIAADSGTGKSTISLQAALQLSCGVPLFGVLEVQRPYRCYYIQKERAPEEVGERIQLMQKVVPWIDDNFILDADIQHMNLAKESNWQPIIDRIIPYKPEIIFIDPIYAGTPGLTKDEVASSFTAFLTNLEHDTGATVYLNHHTPKLTYDRDGNPIEKIDPIYGSTLIKAHVTAAYHLKQITGGVLLERKKDNHLNLLESIELEFDKESYISHATGDYGSGHDRVLVFINRMQKLDKTFNLDEIIECTRLSRASIMRIFEDGKFRHRLENISKNGRKGIYKII